MIFKTSILKTLTIVSCCGSLICILLNYLTNISPLRGIWFPIYFLIIFIISVVISFKCVQWLLTLDEPLKYDINRWHPYLKSILPKNYIEKAPKTLYENEVEKEYETHQLSKISSVLEKKLVSSWYLTYISEELGFPFACKQILDQMISKGFQICKKIDIKEVYIDINSIIISHLREYRKAIKNQKTSSGAIESHYKKFHYIFHNSSKKKYPSGEHYTNILRLIIKDLVPWDQWDTPHLELLVRILSKRLDVFLDATFTNPVWLNDKLHTLLKKDVVKEELSVKKEDLKEEIPEQYMPELKDTEEQSKEEIKNLEVPDFKRIENTIESELPTNIAETKAPILLHSAIGDEVAFVEVVPMENIEEMKVTDPVQIQSSPQMRQRRGRQRQNEVKIYDRVVEGSVKTWETDMDLQCISLGQDLLASLDGEITLSRLWEQDANEISEGWSPNPHSQSKSPQPLWFGEEEMEIELVSPQTEMSLLKKESSPKPTDALLKDIQSTVSQAKTKIVDLQVAFDSDLDVPRKPSHTGDEAAGMMEGLLDFGIAGLKKGLRFTGLHDDSQEKSPLHSREKVLDRSSPDGARSKNMADIDEFVPLTTVIQRDDHPVPLLQKQSRVSSQDSVASQAKLRMESSIPIPVPLCESPEPEYEETNDLSSSIAKLRSLLQAQDSPPGARVEETRGRTARSHASHASRAVDVAALADEYDMTADKLPEQSINNIQRLDKLLQRTVTGVFNSLRTAVGEDAPSSPANAPLAPLWAYVCADFQLGVGCAVARLLGNRKAAVVDAALDSLNLEPAHMLDNQQLSDVGASRASASCALELARAALVWRSHAAHRALGALLADVVEYVTNAWLEEFTVWLNREIFNLCENVSQDKKSNNQKEKPKEMREFNLDETCRMLMDKLPGPLLLFGEETLLSSINFTVSSFSHKDINEDIVFRLLDMAVLHFKKSATFRNPTFDVI